MSEKNEDEGMDERMVDKWMDSNFFGCKLESHTSEEMREENYGEEICQRRNMS